MIEFSSILTLLLKQTAVTYDCIEDKIVLDHKNIFLVHNLTFIACHTSVCLCISCLHQNRSYIKDKTQKKQVFH